MTLRIMMATCFVVRILGGRFGARWNGERRSARSDGDGSVSGEGVERGHHAGHR